MNVSPLAPAEFPVLPSIAGVRLSPLELRLRYHGRPDVLLASFDEGTTVAGAFTTSKCPSAPVDWCKSILGNGVARALVVNAGNANAFTGRHGDASTRATAAAVSSALGIAESEVFLASTGVIGEPLDVGPIVAAVPELVGGLSAADAENLKSAAHAIRTTDTFPKAEGARATLPSGAVVNVAGIAKGSGMIEPAMATMLSFVFTDAAITAEALQSMLSPSVTTSYNAITVDSDTSTSDTVLVFATGAAGNDLITGPDSPGYDELAEALHRVNLGLAHLIVRDGEGASKFVTVNVTGAESDAAAQRIARAIANSPLVKTALAASDANWGRLVMAVGKSGEAANRDALAIWIGDEHVAVAGEKLESYSEERATEHLQGDEVTLTVDVGVGSGAGTIWTCDLTHGYIDINAGYRS
ncbi:MAG: bifunctional glutamate N-acetyltransferase/amino-acid acetyltransferase ArgJ [Acidimicrobiales bacterium]